jgi:Core-2/I-Branching enzyme.
MKVAYLILAHRNPRLIKKAVECLSCEGISFFIHIDAKVDISQFDSIRGENVFFIDKRIAVYWGEFSQTEAIFLLIQEALAAPERYDYLVLLSGSDFPLRSGRYVRSFLEKHQGHEFITMFKLPVPGMPISRINTLRFPSTRPILRFVFRALAKFGLAQRDYRKHLSDLQPYSGHTWWALSRESCQYVMDFRQKHFKVAEFFKYTFASDEMLIHTILGNSPFKSRIRRHLVFEDWPVEGPRSHPKDITAQHIDSFESQDEVAAIDVHGPGEMLFARKFSDDDLHLVERVEQMTRKKDHQRDRNLIDVRG